MVRIKTECPVCGCKNEESVRDKNNLRDGGCINAVILNKVGDNTFNCNLDIQCNDCRLTYRVNTNLEL